MLTQLGAPFADNHGIAMSHTKPAIQPHPITFVRARIQDASVRRAFDQVTLDDKSPLQIDAKEVDTLFRAASRDNPFVRGDATRPAELEDLKMIRERGGAWLFSTVGAQSKFDSKLKRLDSLPKVEWNDDDGSLRSSQVALNKVSIRGDASGFVWCPPNARCIGAPSTVRVEVDGQTFSVHPKTGESSSSVASRLAEAMKKDGYRVSISRYRGAAILTVKSAPEVKTPSFDDRQYAQLTGTVVKHDEQNPGPSGGYEAYGSWLQLAQPIRVGDLTVSKVYVENREELAAGTQVNLNGRLDLREGHQEIFPLPRFVVMTGVSNLTAGEPKFDGEKFTNDLGKELATLFYNRPLMYDAPAHVYALDQAHDTVFVGSMGGMRPQWINPFHGWRGVAAIENPSRADLGAVRWQGNEPVSRATGEALVAIGDEGQGRQWYFDASNNTGYRFSGRVMDQVFHAQR